MEHGEGDFLTLALDLYRHQVARNPTYAALAEGAQPRSIAEIPAVPVALFQSLPLTCFPPEDATVVFRTSGTTGSARGVQRLRDTTLYDLGAWRHFWGSGAEERGRPPSPVLASVASLCPTDADSSLGHMVARFASALGAAPPLALFGPDGLAPDAWARLSALPGPTFLASTAFALDALFAQPGAIRLDERSLVMVTGGFKGREVRLDAPALYAAIPARLGAPRVIGEYGMTELSSQLWTRPVPAGEVPGAFFAPHWMRVYTVDPASGAPTTGGGLLRFVDLANVDSVLAIETMDLGRVDGSAVTLLGRLQGAEARGCSLRAEQFVASAHASTLARRSPPR